MGFGKDATRVKAVLCLLLVSGCAADYRSIEIPGEIRIRGIAIYQGVKVPLMERW